MDESKRVTDLEEMPPHHKGPRCVVCDSRAVWKNKRGEDVCGFCVDYDRRSDTEAHRGD